MDNFCTLVTTPLRIHVHIYFVTQFGILSTVVKLSIAWAPRHEAPCTMPLGTLRQLYVGKQPLVSSGWATDVISKKKVLDPARYRNHRKILSINYFLPGFGLSFPDSKSYSMRVCWLAWPMVGHNPTNTAPRNNPVFGVRSEPEISRKLSSASCSCSLVCYLSIITDMNIIFINWPIFVTFGMNYLLYEVGLNILSSTIKYDSHADMLLGGSTLTVRYMSTTEHYRKRFISWQDYMEQMWSA
jgi:hypothetical protein